MTLPTPEEIADSLMDKEPDRWHRHCDEWDAAEMAVRSDRAMIAKELRRMNQSRDTLFNDEIYDLIRELEEQRGDKK